MIHMTVLLQRKEGITKEQFDEYWSKTHATVFMGNPAARERLVRYTQQHLSPPADNAEKLGELGARPIPADGVVHFWARSLDDLTAVFASDYYRDVVVPDEGNFIQRGREQISVGYDEDKWLDGRSGPGVDTSTWPEYQK